MKPIKREKFDKVVTAMFRSADTNRDGFVTLEEHRALIDSRKNVLIRARFEKIDSNGNGSLDLDEFFAWQRGMGSLALSDDQPLVGSGGPVPEIIAPELGDDIEDRVLGRLIEPLGAVTIVNANANYDSGVTLEELIAYQGKRFEAADTDGDGAVSMEEARALDGGERGPRGGNPPNRRPPG